MSKASNEWYDAMQRAFVTMEDCTCPSKDHAEIRPHDDDCPTTLLRDKLTNGSWEWQSSRSERILVAIGNALNWITEPVALRLTGHLGLWALPVVGVVLVAWMGWPFIWDKPVWLGFANLPISMYLGGVGGRMLSEHIKLLHARRGLR